MSGAGDAGGAGEAPVVFREVTKGESRLWKTKRIHHADLNRLHLRSIECILDPTVPADNIIGGYLQVIYPNIVALTISSLFSSLGTRDRALR